MLRGAGRIGAAAAAGAAGLGTEVLLLSVLGLSLGHGRASALGLATWIAGWSLGAWWAGRRGPAGPARLLLRIGPAAALAGPLALLALLALGREDVPGGGLLALVCVAGAAFPQGGFLPLLASGTRGERASRTIHALYAAGLVGSVAGAELVGDLAPGLFGRPGASLAAAGLALVATLLGVLCSGPAGTPPAPGEVPVAPSGHRLGRTRAGLLLGLATASVVAAEWVAWRLGALWLGGMQPALSALLSASLLSLGLGALVLPPLLPRDGRAVAWLLVLAALGSLWPLVAAPALAATSGRLAQALVLAGPLLVAHGALVPCLARATDPGREGGRRLGDLLLHESWGALAAAPLAHLLLVEPLGLAGTLGMVDLVLGLGAFLLLGGQPLLARLAPLALVLAGAVLLGAREPALDSPQLANPAFALLSFEEDRAFAVSVVQDGVRGERTLLTDEFRATGTGDDYLYMQVLGHLPVLLHPAPRRVGVLAFGTGTTAGAVSLHPEVERIEVFELSRSVVRAAPHFREVNHGVLDEGLPGLLDDGDGRDRVVVHLGDGRRRLAEVAGRLDVLTMEPLLPDSPFAVYLYTREFYERTRSSLAPGGLVCQWVPPHALEPRVFQAVLEAFARAFPWSGVFQFGTQVILVGGDELPELRAERFRGQGGELGLALERLGLEGKAGLAARYLFDGGVLGSAGRPLTDADPWIVHARRDRGRQVLEDLPTNLEWLRARSTALPPAWARAFSLDELGTVLAVARLREAREVFELERAGWLGSAGVDEARRAWLEQQREWLAEQLPEDGERLAFERRVRFERARTRGVTALRAGMLSEGFDLLTLAASLRPERADVHLFVAVAALGMGQDRVARAAATRAFELCPGLADTPQGRLALSLDGGGLLLGLLPDGSRR